jgi:type I restriction enzyme, S subunit
VPYLSADELFTLSPSFAKRIIIDPLQAEEAQKFFVKEGWLVMACSGQTHGLNGSVALVTAKHTNCFLSHDIIRIAPKAQSIRSGYLLVAWASFGHSLCVCIIYSASRP